MNTDDIESRLEKIAQLFEKVNTLIEEQLPIKFPKAVEDLIKNAIFNNEDMVDLIDGIKNRRPPKFILIGRTGVGKSSLINAMCGRYLAKVSDVEIGTREAQRFSYTYLGKTIFEVIDTRGIAEAEEVGSKSAEAALSDAMRNFEPDAILFLTPCTARDHLDSDAAFLKLTISQFKSKIPVIGLLTRADEMPPSREKEPEKYPAHKVLKIQQSAEQVKRILDNQGISYLDVFSVSSYIEWNQEPSTLSEEEWSNLKIDFDGRYKIDYLLDLLEDNLQIRAGIFLMLATRLDRASRKLSRKIAKVFSTAAAVVGVNPIPFSDLYILLALQSLMLMLIAYLAGYDISFNSAKKLIISLGGNGLAGLGFRALAQQSAKALNVVTPGAGSLVSGGVAAAGTYGVGEAAIQYYFDGLSPEKLYRVYEDAKRDYEKDEKL